jgi:FMN phosphatase YigB (HAD superfamily)
MRVAFDIGNVLSRVDLTVFTNQAKEFGLHDGFLEEIQVSQDLGLYSMRQAVSKCVHLDSHHPDKDERVKILEQAWLDTVKISDIMIEFVDELIKERVEVALLSNIGVDHRDLILRKAPALKKCQYKHFSCEIGARKPSKLFFQSFVLESGWDGKTVVYFDDRLENFNYLNKMPLWGWRCVHFDLSKYDNDNEALDILVRELKINRSPLASGIT